MSKSCVDDFLDRGIAAMFLKVSGVSLACQLRTLPTFLHALPDRRKQIAVEPIAYIAYPNIRARPRCTG